LSVDDLWTALVMLLHVLLAVLLVVVKLCMDLRWGCGGRPSTSLEVFETSLELLACTGISFKPAVWKT
jgi:hypothetical protein